MRRLIESTFVTLDGVIENPQVWGPPYWDDEHNAYATKLLGRSGALLLGRVTYEGFIQAWPGRDGDYANRINGMPKHVASRTLDETTWNASLLEGDVPDAITALKEQDGDDILKFGTGELDRTLIPAKLVDELHLWIFPVLAGGGQRLLDGIDVQHLERVETTPFASGIVVNTYAPT